MVAVVTVAGAVTVGGVMGWGLDGLRLVAVGIVDAVVAVGVVAACLEGWSFGDVIDGFGGTGFLNSVVIVTEGGFVAAVDGALGDVAAVEFDV